jgi:hypothetical protein
MLSTEETARRRWAWLLDAAVCAGGLAMMFAPTIFSGFARMQADPGDTVLNHYLLEHSWRWLSDSNYPASFWSPRFFYPTPDALTYSESMIGAAPIYWAFRVACPEETAWQWWMLLVSGMNFWAMLIVLRWFGVNPLLAALGGVLFAFGLPRQDQIGHQQLLPHFFAPFAVWFFWRLVNEPNRRAWALFLALTAAQLLASIHLGWFLLLGLAVWLVFLTAFDPALLKRLGAFAMRRPVFIAVTLGVWLGGLWLFFRHYYLGNADVRRDYFECLFFMPRLSTWLACPQHSVWGLYLAVDEPAHLPERHLGMGLAFLTLLMGGLFAALLGRRSEGGRTRAALGPSAVLACLALVVLTAKFGEGSSLWRGVYDNVPGAKSIRVVGRVCFSVMLIGLIGSLVALNDLLETRVASPRLRLGISFVVLLLAAGEQVRLEADSFERRVFYPHANELALAFAGADVVFVQFEPPGNVNDLGANLFAMWAGLHAGVPTVNGYSGRLPAAYAEAIARDPELGVLELLGEKWQGRLLIVDRRERVRKWYAVQPGTDNRSRVSLSAVQALRE